MGGRKGSKNESKKRDNEKTKVFLAIVVLIICMFVLLLIPELSEDGIIEKKRLMCET